MPTNKSLAKFSKVTRGLWVSGVAIWVGLVIVNLALGRGIGEGSQDAFTLTLLASPFFSWLFNVGLALISLSIFSAFLRITAKSIIEGLGGNVNRSEPSTVASGPLVSSTYEASASASHLPAAVPEPSNLDEVSSFVKNPYEWARTNLSSSNFEWWDEYGNPDLTSWIAGGKPDFKEWIKAR